MKRQAKEIGLAKKLRGFSECFLVVLGIIPIPPCVVPGTI
jgi:hypothetical protein